jgi:hypothetical protein
LDDSFIKMQKAGLSRFLHLTLFQKSDLIRFLYLALASALLRISHKDVHAFVINAFFKQ